MTEPELMDAALQGALVSKLLALADDELILGHRNSEWTGHAPILEEDIAFANIAQDEMGHAGVWLTLRCDLTGEVRDQLVFFRESADFRNVRLVEFPRRDWAFTILRQYLFDAYESTLLQRLKESSYRPLSEAAAKIQPEELYHYRHTHTWVQRLGLGTAESNRRMQSALDALWPLSAQLFQAEPGDSLLVDAGYFPALAEVRGSWLDVVSPVLRNVGLRLPDLNSSGSARLSRANHTKHLAMLLQEMQEVARADPQAEW